MRPAPDDAGPGGGSPDWARIDAERVWHPFTQARTAAPPLPVVGAEGVWLHLANGRRILDGISSWWVNIHGHGHPRLVEAVARQARALQQVIFAGCTHEPAARLAGRLAEVTPQGLERVFYSDDGSTAVEVALKMAAQWWRLRGEEGRTLFVALEHAYHGDTFGAMAAGGIPVFHEAFRPFLCDVARVPAPHPFAFDGGRDPGACARACLDALERTLAREAGRVIAVVLEPVVQAAGGMIVQPAAYLRGVRELCDRAGVLLIADEVFTGFGRTGRLFACEHGPVSPDLLCLSKALTGGVLPLGATLCTEAIHEAFLDEDRGRAFFHGHSYTANPIACAAALESLAVLEDERSLERVAAMEARFARRLDRLRGHPLVGDARGIGGLAALELATGGPGGYLDDAGPWLAARLLERGVLLRPLGNVLYVLPPYAIAGEEIELVFDAIEEALDGLAARDGS